MNVEAERLGTFREWPANAAVDATRLARAGFYYTGHGLEVQCFLCGTKISDWNYSDQAMARHQLKAPSCPFVIDPAGTCNVPLLSAATVAVESATSSGPQQYNGVENNSCSRLSSVQDYRTVSQRLRSFNNWPITSIIEPERLALAGFYYLQYQDMVECAFCKGILMNWKSGDDPECEHRLNFPNCDFYLREGNIEDDILGLVKVMSSTTNITELGIQKHKAPCRPQYATYERRLQTFQEWPENLKQTPEMLAAAGFYYSGCNDQVRCFHCDGGLREWQPTDNVWVEHAQWFPTCGFINLVRGHKFVQHCVANRTPTDLSVFAGILEDTDTDVTETSVASLSTVEQPNKPVVSVADVAEASVASLSTVLQPSEPIADAEDVMETSIASVSTVLQPNEPVTDPTMSVTGVAEASDASFSAVLQPSEPVTAVSVADVTETSTVSLSTVSRPSESVTNTADLSTEDVAGTSDASVSTILQTKKPITDRELERLLNTIPAKAALEIGLHVGRVRRALKRRMEEVGRPYTNTAQLIQDVLHDQIMEEDTSLDSNTNSSTSELNNLFNCFTTQTVNNFTSKNNTQESDVSERELEEKITDNESDNIMFLREENRKLKESRLCKICMDHELAIVFLPCGHLTTCNNCAPALANCPLCRLKIDAYIRIFFS